MYTLKAFFKSKWLEIGIIAISFQLVTNAVSIFLENKPVSLVLTAIGLIFLIVLVTSAYDAVRSGDRTIGDGEAIEIKRRGVIFTVGLKSHEANSIVMKAIKKMSPQYCGFIGTDKTFGSNIGKIIAQTFNLGEEFYREKAVDPTNVREIKEDTVHLIHWMIDRGLSKEEIVVDVTGGTAIMSVASYMAADENKVDTQYIYSEYRDNKPIEGTQKALIVSRYATR